jgi:hypothetical protein
LDRFADATCCWRGGDLEINSGSSIVVLIRGVACVVLIVGGAIDATARVSMCVMASDAWGLLLSLYDLCLTFNAEGISSAFIQED